MKRIEKISRYDNVQVKAAMLAIEDDEKYSETDNILINLLKSHDNLIEVISSIASDIEYVLVNYENVYFLRHALKKANLALRKKGE